MRAKNTRNATPWIVKSRVQLVNEERRNACEIVLYCLPQSGSGTGLYRDWWKLLPPWIEVCPVELPGRNSRTGEKCIDSMDLLVDEIVGNMFSERMWPEKDFVIFGHSMGSWIALALARALQIARDAGKNKGRLLCTIVSGTCPPVSVKLNEGGKRKDKLSVLPKDKFWECWGERHPDEKWKRMEGDDVKDVFYTMIKADCEIMEGYEDKCMVEEQPQLVGDLCAMAAEDDPGITVRDFESWARFSTAGVSLKLFGEGGHSYVFEGSSKTRLDVFGFMVGAIRKSMEDHPGGSAVALNEA